MKRLIIAAFIALTSISCSKLKGQGDIISQTYDFGSAHITNISIANGFTLTFTDDLESGIVEITSYENVLNYISVTHDANNYKISITMDATRTEGDLHLVARMKHPTACSAFTATGGSAYVFESTQTITDKPTALYLTGGSMFYGYNYTGKSISLGMSGSSTTEITLAADATIAGNMSGNSSLRYKGVEVNNENITAALSGASSIDYITE
ncbi:MAG: DUF2807 domain-containing protein [Rikenellaceae bacterium]